MGCHRLDDHHPICCEATGDAHFGIYPELASGGMDGGVECRSQAATNGGDGRGSGAGVEVDPPAATGTASCTTKGREERNASVQGAGEEICDVETERHVGTGEGVEDGSDRRGKEAL